MFAVTLSRESYSDSSRAWRSASSWSYGSFRCAGIPPFEIRDASVKCGNFSKGFLVGGMACFFVRFDSVYSIAQPAESARHMAERSADVALLAEHVQQHRGKFLPARHVSPSAFCVASSACPVTGTPSSRCAQRRAD